MSNPFDFSDITKHLSTEYDLNMEMAEDTANLLGKALQSELKRVTPVGETGNASNSWHYYPSPSGGYVESDCEYMSALNAGSSSQEPAGFVENAADTVARRV